VDSSKLKTCEVFNNYDLIIRQVEKWIYSKKPQIFGCEEVQVKARLVQRITEMASTEYAQQSINHVNKFSKPLPYWPKRLVAGGLHICTETGKVSTSLEQWVRNIILFTASWSHLFIFLVAALFKKAPQHSSSATLLMEAGDSYEKSDARLVRFCRQGPIEPLSSANQIIIRTKISPLNPSDPSFHYNSDPLIYLISTFLKRSIRFTLLLRHLTAPFYYLKALINFPLNILASRDLSIIPACLFLNKKKMIEAIFITTSNFSSQPLWMKGLKDQQFKLHMIWYAQNFIPHMFLGEQKPTHLPHARHMRVDVHWVWTEGFKSYLKQLGQTSEIRVVGPILWYLPEQIEKTNNTCIKIALFDVTPLPDGKKVYGIVKNYYSVSTMKKFITDTIKVCDEITVASGKKVLVILKHKRAPKTGYHDSLYLELLRQTVKNKPYFKLIDPKTNLFGLLEECDLSISIPYTSTSYVAASLEKPTIFYDPSAEVIPLYEKSEFVHFASGPENLKQLMEKILNARQSSPLHFGHTEARQ